MPTNVYPTRDGHVFMAIGSDVQWSRFTALPRFKGVGSDARRTNEGRLAERDAIHRDIAAVTTQHTADAVLADLAQATIPATRIQDIRQVRESPPLQGKLTRTTLPNGQTLRMQPLAVDSPGAVTDLPFAPRYGQHTRAVLAEAGLSSADVAELLAAGIAA